MFQRMARIAVVAAVALCVGATPMSRAHGQSKRPPIVPPRPIKLVTPDCGAGQSCHGIRGIVVVTVDVLTDGTVGDANLKNGDPRLADIAVQAARQCRFEPGTFNGKPTNMDFDIKYQF